MEKEVDGVEMGRRGGDCMRGRAADDVDRKVGDLDACLEVGDLEVGDEGVGEAEEEEEEERGGRVVASAWVTVRINSARWDSSLRSWSLFSWWSSARRASLSLLAAISASFSALAAWTCATWRSAFEMAVSSSTA